MMRRLGTILLVGLVGSSLCLPAWAQSDADTRDARSLQGLEGVYLVVDSFAAELESDGLYASAVEADVERQLQAAGIPLLTREEAVADPRQPRLHIDIESTLTSAGLHAYSIVVEFRQNVRLMTKGEAEVAASTWTASPMTRAAARDQVEWINDDIRSLVGEFVQAYASVNQQQ